MEIKLTINDGNLTNINLLDTNFLFQERGSLETKPFLKELEAAPLTMLFYCAVYDDKQKFLGKLN